MRAYGGQLTFSKPDMASREAACKRVQEATGAVFIPPFNHRHVMAGQARLPIQCLPHGQVALGRFLGVLWSDQACMSTGNATAVKGPYPTPDLTKP